MRFLFIKKNVSAHNTPRFRVEVSAFLLVDWSVGNRVVRSKININKNRQAFMRKAKIVDTIGPATESLEGITSLVEAGMDVARLNRSPRHSGRPPQGLQHLRAAAKATGRNVAALVDLQGPKIRCGWFKKNADGEDKVQLTEGQEFVITTDDIEGDEHITSTTFKGLPGDCHAGDPILIDDGKVRLEVTKVEGNNVYTKVVVAGPVSSHKGINLPGVAVSLPALTEKDEADLRWAIRTGADIIAMSFVRFATDIDRAHEIMDEEGRRIPVVAKIEKPQALENLEEIVKAFDGIMVARGDMAVECRSKRFRWLPSAASSSLASTPSRSSWLPKSSAPWSIPRFRPVQRHLTALTPSSTVPTRP